MLNIFKSKFLVISAVGDSSLHKEWISSNKNFDLALVYYGDQKEKYKKDADYYLESKGYKWHLISEIYEKFEHEFSKYDFIWCPDDDVSASPDTLNQMFSYCESKSLNLAQPSLSSDSFYDMPITLNKFNLEFRYTNVVEQMAPVFSLDVFKKLKSTFLETKSGWGLDWVWPKILEYKNCGIIDLVQVKHTREPKVGELYSKYKKEEVYPPAEKKKLLRRYGIPIAICTEISNIERPMQRVCTLHEVSKPKFKFSHFFRRDNGCSNACRKVGTRLLNFKNLID